MSRIKIRYQPIKVMSSDPAHKNDVYYVLRGVDKTEGGPGKVFKYEVDLGDGKKIINVPISVARIRPDGSLMILDWWFDKNFTVELKKVSAKKIQDGVDIIKLLYKEAFNYGPDIRDFWRRVKLEMLKEGIGPEWGRVYHETLLKVLKEKLKNIEMDAKDLRSIIKLSKVADAEIKAAKPVEKNIEEIKSSYAALIKDFGKEAVVEVVGDVSIYGNIIEILMIDEKMSQQEAQDVVRAALEEGIDFEDSVKDQDEGEEEELDLEEEYDALVEEYGEEVVEEIVGSYDDFVVLVEELIIDEDLTLEEAMDVVWMMFEEDGGEEEYEEEEDAEKFYNSTVNKEKEQIKFANYADLKKAEAALTKAKVQHWKRKGEDTLIFEQSLAFKKAVELLGLKDGMKVVDNSGMMDSFTVSVSVKYGRRASDIIHDRKIKNVKATSTTSWVLKTKDDAEDFMEILVEGGIPEDEIDMERDKVADSYFSGNKKAKHVLDILMRVPGMTYDKARSLLMYHGSLKNLTSLKNSKDLLKFSALKEMFSDMQAKAIVKYLQDRKKVGNKIKLNRC